MLWPSQRQDLTTWETSHLLVFGGQLLDLPMTYLQFPCLSPDGYRGLLKVKISQISENLEIWESLVSICVKDYRNQVT